METNIDSYIQGKRWFIYMPVWLFCVYVFIELLKFSPDEPQPWIIAVPQSFNFMLHEMMHILTIFLPPIMTAASGSLSEIFLGIMLVVTAFKTRGYVASMICFLWLMLACLSAGSYMADARAQNLELSSLGADLTGSSSVIHDWHYVFSQLQILPFDTVIGGFVRTVGIIAGLGGLVFGLWLMYKMKMAKSAGPS